MTEVYPTLACADYLNLGRDISMLDGLGAASYHIDIMDGNFVPNYCLNFDYLKAVKKASSTPCDVHLMTTEVERDIMRSLDSGADAVAFHAERDDLDIRHLLALIRGRGCRAGLAVSPSSPLDILADHLSCLDYVLVMAVTPGFSGQSFLEGTYERIRALAAMRDDMDTAFKIVVDGGIDFDNAPLCADAGADCLIGGALCIFSGRNGLESDARRFFRLLEA